MAKQESPTGALLELVRMLREIGTALSNPYIPANQVAPQWKKLAETCDMIEAVLLFKPDAPTVPK